MSSRSLLLSSSCLALLAGCALHTPYNVLYGTIDYNTERHLSVQAESFDHLPLEPIRIKLMRFGYNVGPLPSGTGWGACRHSSWNGADVCEPEMMIAPQAPVADPIVPPAPPAQGAAAGENPTTVDMAGYSGEQACRAPNAAWLFGAPMRR